MIIGVVRETKPFERRAALTPDGTRVLVEDGHVVLIEAGAGAGAGMPDERYAAAGARVVGDRARVYGDADLILHVKEPQPADFDLLRKDQVLFTFLHLAAYPEVGHRLLEAGVTGIGYETVEMPDGELPLLAPMSRIAGRLAAQDGAHYLEGARGGKGILLGGIPGVEPGHVVVLGAGVAGVAAVDVAVGLGARVTVLDVKSSKLERVEERFGGRVSTLHSRRDSIARSVREADLLIGAVLKVGARAPVLVDRSLMKEMEPGSVLVDLAIDQGGCFAGSRETTHDHPTYERDGLVHYAVGNIPSTVGRTATLALTNSTLAYVRSLARGLPHALAEHPELVEGVNVLGGRVTNSAVAAALGEPYVPLAEVMR